MGQNRNELLPRIKLAIRNETAPLLIHLTVPRVMGENSSSAVKRRILSVNESAVVPIVTKLLVRFAPAPCFRLHMGIIERKRKEENFGNVSKE